MEVSRRVGAPQLLADAERGDEVARAGLGLGLSKRDLLVFFSGWALEEILEGMGLCFAFILVST